jgi:Ser/Thr protein kinase RdoA (MazF antagonist)
MLRNDRNEYVLFDFDVASRAYSVIDVATLSDASDFFTFCDEAYDNTSRRLERFCQGYSRERTLTDAEMTAVFDFIAVRHFELIPTIVECQGVSLATDYIDRQYAWLMNWRELCAKNRL